MSNGGTSSPQARAHEMLNRVAAAPVEARARILEEMLAALPADERELITPWIAGTKLVMSSGKKPLNWERVALFTIAVLFLITFLAIAVFIPNPTQSQRETFRTILALMAAAFGAFIPGLITVEMKLIPGLALRAVGAMALFAVVYFYLPKV